jgi:hypothetical protein
MLTWSCDVVGVSVAVEMKIYIDAIVEVIVRFGLIAGLWSPLGHTIRSMHSAGNVNEYEMESENSEDPSIDTGT